MSTATCVCVPKPGTDSVQSIFLALLPRIQRQAALAFRHIRCPQRREDAVAETIALAWKWCLSLVKRAKDVRGFPASLAYMAVRAVSSGRRLCGQEAAKDPLSRRAQKQHGLHLRRLNSMEADSLVGESLRHNRHTPVPEQAAFRCDFPRWRRSQSPRNGRIMDDLILGHRTSDVARKFGLSSARISQLRRAFRTDWEAFCGNAQE